MIHMYFSHPLNITEKKVKKLYILYRWRYISLQTANLDNNYEKIIKCFIFIPSKKFDLFFTYSLFEIFPQKYISIFDLIWLILFYLIYCYRCTITNH